MRSGGRATRAFGLGLAWAWLAAATSASAAAAIDTAAADTLGTLLILRRQYNEVAAAIDTLVRIYSAERFENLTDAQITPGGHLLEGQRLVWFMWADDEARAYLNGAPVGATRLTPVRIEIPEAYLQAHNVITVRCWDTDRVESGFMAGLYVEDDGGLRPVLTTTEEEGWTVAGQPAREIYYAHSSPDIPRAQVMWGPQLFGSVELVASFAAAAVSRAARQAPVAAPPPARPAPMDFDRVVARLVGLQARRRELAQRLQAAGAGAEPPAYLRYHEGAPPPGPAFTLGQAAPLQAADDRKVSDQLRSWTRRLPASQRQLVVADPRPLLGPGAATPALPLPEAKPDGAALPGDRRADYRPPADRGTRGEGQGIAGTGTSGTAVVALPPSARFLWRMGLLAVGLAAWTGVAGWSGWRQWRRPGWRRPRS